MAPKRAKNARPRFQYLISAQAAWGIADTVAEELRRVVGSKFSRDNALAELQGWVRWARGLFQDHTPAWLLPENVEKLKSLAIKVQNVSLPACSHLTLSIRCECECESILSMLASIVRKHLRFRWPFCQIVILLADGVSASYRDMDRL